MTSLVLYPFAVITIFSLLLIYCIRKQARQYGIIMTILMVIPPTGLIILDAQNPLFKNLTNSRLLEAYFSYPKFLNELIQLLMVHSYVCFLFGMTYLLFFFVRRVPIPVRLMLILPFFSYICLYYLFVGLPSIS